MHTLVDHHQRVEIAVHRPRRHPSRATRTPRRQGWYQRRGKRLFDLAATVMLIVVLAPLITIVAVSVRLALGPPVLLRQRRVGEHGYDFTLLKFRTMRPDRRVAQVALDRPDRRRTHKSTDDPRHTPLGLVLRRTSLDELPQLLNVLKGDMSLVGPRPELASVVDARGLRQHPRHRSRPGLTGSWQVGARNSGALLCDCFDEPLDPPTWRHDLRVLATTLVVVTRGEGR